jgi:large subunit ribosomal protein L4
MELAVYNTKGEKTTRTVVLDESIFGITPNDHAIYLDVKQYLANQRQGTHASKERWAVAGSTRKIKKQKGTGSARAGSIKNPLFHGGGRVFGPHPRDYSFKLNKKLKQLARRSALAYKATDEAIMVLEDFSFEAPKTRNFSELIGKLECKGIKTLVVLPASDSNVVLSARNLPKATVALASQITTYEILNAKKLILTEGSVKVIQGILGKDKE